VSVRCVYILTFHCNIRVSVLVYAGVGSGYSVWMLFRCISNVLVFASVIVALNSAVLLVAWQGCCVCPVLQRGSELLLLQHKQEHSHEYCSGKVNIYTQRTDTNILPG